MAKKVSKIILKVLLWVFLGLLALDLSLVGLCFVPSVQNKLVDFVTDKVSEAWGSEISIDNIYITPSFKIKAKGVDIKDKHHKEMIFVGNLSGRISSLNLSPVKIKFSTIQVDRARVVIKKYRGSDSVNISEWAKIFTKKKTGKIFTLQSSDLSLTHSYFVYEDENRRVHQNDSIIDYAFFELDNIELTANNFKVVNDDISANIKKLALTQYSGFQLLNAAGNFRINRNTLTFENLALVTPQSRLFLDLAFHYDSWNSYGEFVDSVFFEAKVHPSSLQLSDVAYFVPQIKGMNNRVIVSAFVDGPVNALNVNKLNAHYKNQTSLFGRLSIFDITRGDSLRFDANLKNCCINLSELTDFLLPKEKKISLPKMITDMGNTKCDLVYQGTLADFDAKALLKNSFGEVDANFMLRHKDKSISYEGSVSTPGFQVGRLLRQEKLLGSVAMNLDLKGTALPKQLANSLLSSAKADIIGKVSRADVLNYPLRDISFDAKFKQLQVDATVQSLDSNLRFFFEGMGDWRTQDPNYQAYLDIYNFAPGNMVKLYPKVDSTASGALNKMIYYVQNHPSFNVSVNSMGLKMHGTSLDNINGYALIDNLECQVENKQFDIENLRLVAINKENVNHQMILTSNLLNASVKTDYSLQSVVQALTSTVYGYFAHLLPPKSEKLKKFEHELNNEEHYLTLHAETYNLRKFMDMFMPQCYIAPRSTLYIHTNSVAHEDSLLVNSNWVSFNRKLFFNDIEISGRENDNALNITARCDTFGIRQKNDALKFNNIGLHTEVINSHLAYTLQWKNPQVISEHVSHVNGDIDFKNREHIIAHFAPSQLYIKDDAWKFSEHNALHILKEGLQFDNVGLQSSKSKIMADGSYSNNINDSLVIDVENFDISILNSYLQSSGMTFAGDVSTKLNLTKVNNNKAYTGRVMISDFKFNEEYLGNVFLLAYLPNNGNIFFTGGISQSDAKVNSAMVSQYDYINFQREKRKTAKLNGYYDINEHLFKVFAKIDTVHIGFLSPFLASFSNSVRGHASGDLAFIAKPDTFYFDGKVNVQDAYLKIAPLNTDYHIHNQEIIFDRKGITFDNIYFTDKFENKGILQGYVHHRKFSDFKIDLNIVTPKILVLNTEKDADSPFYGDGFVSGSVSITGDTKNLYFTGKNLKTEQGSVVHLPISFADKTYASDVISFKVDPSKILQSEERSESNSSTNMVFDFAFDLTQDAIVQLDMDLSAMTGTLQAHAEGPLRLTYDDKNDLNIYGSAILSTGNFVMKVKDLLTKRFSLVEGGTVLFDGPLDNMVIDASAVYSTSASLSDLIPAEMTNASLRRLPVKAYLNLSGKFMQNPGIGFSFELPNSNTELSSLFYGAIDTTNNQNMIEQFFSLLVLGKFQANKEMSSSSSFSTTDLGGSGIGILTNTISNFISNQLKNTNINLNYQNADLDHAAEYSVATSTSLFNNRTVIESNIGYANDVYNSGNSTTFIGDFSIEQKLNAVGTWRVKVFNVTNQYNQLTSTTPYAQGVALIYKQDFNTGKDIADSFKRTKKKEKKKKKFTLISKKDE